MLITRAGVVLVGTPGTGKPAAHRIASLMSAIEPPHLPSTRTAWTRVCQFTPATPTVLSLLPTPIVPDYVAAMPTGRIGRLARPALAGGDCVAGVGRIGVTPISVIGGERRR